VTILIAVAFNWIMHPISKKSVNLWMNDANFFLTFDPIKAISFAKERAMNKGICINNHFILGGER